MADEYTNSWYCTVVLTLTICTAGYSVGYQLTCLNPVTPVLQRLYNQTHMSRYAKPMPDELWTALLSLTMSMLFIGASASAFFSKILLSRWTRKQLIITTHILNILGLAIIAVGGKAWGSYEAIIIGRFVVGLCIGAGLGLYGIIVNEITVPHRRSFYSGMLGASYNIGALLGVVLGWSKVFGSDQHWVAVIVFGALMSFIYLACSYWIPDTPYQTMLISGQEDAVMVLKKFRSGLQHDMMEEIKTLAGDNYKMKRISQANEASLMEVLKIRQFRKHFFGVVLVFSYLQSCGMSNILFFSDRIFISAGLSLDAVTPATIGVFVGGAVAAYSGIVALKRFDPRTLILFGSAMMILGDALLTASLATYEEVPAMSIVAIVATVEFYFGFSIINMAAYAIAGVICIARTRSVSMNVATMCFWFLGWFVGFISPYLEIWLGPYAFVLWMAITIACSTYIIFYVPTTSGKTEEEIQKFYKK